MALLFPTTLFKDIYKFINKNEVIILCEEPFYFNFNFHPYKLILHRASMKQFHEYLKSLGYSVVYINYERFSIREIKKINIKTMIDPIDKPMISRYTKLFPNIIIIDNLGFINSRNNLTQYYNEINEKGGQPFLNKNFFEWNKKQFNILKNVNQSYDKENRDPISDKIKIPRLPKLFSNNICNSYVKTLNEARNYIDTDTKTNLNNFVFPINHKQANKMLSNFIKYRFKNFGKYQDAIIPEESYLFHSVLSSSLNIGLITAEEVIIAVEKAKGIPIQSKEGFIRQILGWREYIRFCYLFNYNDDFKKLNYFNNKRKLTKSWYTGTTGISIVDETIKKAFKHAYLHHIERLMIIANVMNLAEINPAEIYKWFMEFAIDSYEWVMVPNIFGMGTYADGKITKDSHPISTKPYISSSNYVVNMSLNRVKRDPIWDALYYAFVIKHKKKVKYHYSILRNSIAHKSINERQKITLIANKFKEINT